MVIITRFQTSSKRIQFGNWGEEVTRRYIMAESRRRRSSSTSESNPSKRTKTEKGGEIEECKKTTDLSLAYGDPIIQPRLSEETSVSNDPLRVSESLQQLRQLQQLQSSVSSLQSSLYHSTPATYLTPAVHDNNTNLVQQFLIMALSQMQQTLALVNTLMPALQTLTPEHHLPPSVQPFAVPFKSTPQEQLYSTSASQRQLFPTTQPSTTQPEPPPSVPATQHQSPPSMPAQHQLPLSIPAISSTLLSSISASQHQLSPSIPATQHQSPPSIPAQHQRPLSIPATQSLLPPSESTAHSDNSGHLSLSSLPTAKQNVSFPTNFDQSVLADAQSEKLTGSTPMYPKNIDICPSQLTTACDKPNGHLSRPDLHNCASLSHVQLGKNINYFSSPSPDLNPSSSSSKLASNVLKSSVAPSSTLYLPPPVVQSSPLQQHVAQSSPLQHVAQSSPLQQHVAQSSPLQQHVAQSSPLQHPPVPVAPNDDSDDDDLPIPSFISNTMKMTDTTTTDDMPDLVPGSNASHIKAEPVNAKNVNSDNSGHDQKSSSLTKSGSSWYHTSVKIEPPSSLTSMAPSHLWSPVRVADPSSYEIFSSLPKVGISNQKEKLSVHRIPLYWSVCVRCSPKCKGQYHVIPLEPGQEYERVVDRLLDSKFSIVSVYRIQNERLWKRYRSEQALMLESAPRGYKINQSWLYHTTSARPEVIFEEGLDPRLGHGGHFGKGTYFSDNPMKCFQYVKHCKCENCAQNNPEETFKMLLCRVLLGDFKVYAHGHSDRNLKREPVKSDKAGEKSTYDSVKGNVSGYDEYVVYNPYRVLPEYIIQYTSDNVVNTKALQTYTMAGHSLVQHAQLINNNQRKVSKGHHHKRSHKQGQI